ncbi:hypothetical protein NJ7G_0778 [Natrinema sp. J7-2]|nr:hypothetical protein NJ7G_0778 [Natrinema sp. J7-2]
MSITKCLPTDGSIVRGHPRTETFCPLDDTRRPPVAEFLLTCQGYR